VTELLQCQWNRLQLWWQTIAAQCIISNTPNVCKPSRPSKRATCGWPVSFSALRNSGTKPSSLITNISNSFRTLSCFRPSYNKQNKQTCMKLNVHSSSRSKLPNVTIQSNVYVRALTTSSHRYSCTYSYTSFFQHIFSVKLFTLM